MILNFNYELLKLMNMIMLNKYFKIQFLKYFQDNNY